MFYFFFFNTSGLIYNAIHIHITCTCIEVRKRALVHTYICTYIKGLVGPESSHDGFITKRVAQKITHALCYVQWPRNLVQTVIHMFLYT